jgi:hypothetical protein
MAYKIKSRNKSQQYDNYILYGDKESDEEQARLKLSKIKSRVAKDNFIRKMIKKGIYL